MMHLPGLVISEQMQQVVQAAAQLNITVRGLYGEGTEATGNLFQISNQSTLGDSEDQIVERMTRFTSDLAHQEWNAREAAAPVIFPAGEGPRFPRLRPSDQCHSAFHAGGAGPALLPPDGSVSGHLFPPGIKNVNKTIMNIQPAHLARLSTTDQTTPEHRDQIRADIIRKELSGN